jgi:hypothetical protein
VDNGVYIHNCSVDSLHVRSFHLIIFARSCYFWPRSGIWILFVFVSELINAYYIRVITSTCLYSGYSHTYEYAAWGPCSRMHKISILKSQPVVRYYSLPYINTSSADLLPTVKNLLRHNWKRKSQLGLIVGNRKFLVGIKRLVHTVLNRSIQLKVCTK